MAPNTSIAEQYQHCEGEAMKAAAIEAVESMIQYKFKDPSLLWEALQSRGSSIDIVGHPVPLEGNRRLAIVGDIVLRLVLAEGWYMKGTGVGDFEIRHSTAIGCNSNLDEKGNALRLDRFIFGPRANKTVADTMEAIIGAVYQDDGLTAAKDVMDALDLLPNEERLKREVDVEGFAIINDDHTEILSKRTKHLRELQQDRHTSSMSHVKDRFLFVGEGEDDHGSSREKSVTRQMVKDKVPPPSAGLPDLVFGTSTVDYPDTARGAAVPGNQQLSSAVDALRAFCASPSNDFSRDSQGALLMPT